jgi:hypothetical protein
MDYPNPIACLMAGDLPPLKDLKKEDLMSLALLLMVFTAGRAMGRDKLTTEVQSSYYEQLLFIQDVLKGASGVEFVYASLKKDWPKSDQNVKTTKLNHLSIVSQQTPKDHS